MESRKLNNVGDDVAAAIFYELIDDRRTITAYWNTTTKYLIICSKYYAHDGL